MKICIKPISILLALVLICGMFTAVPVAAAEDEAAVTPSGLLREKSVDITAVGSDADLAGTGHYNIAVGNVTVTDSNCSNILGDSANPHKAIYDPQKKILTLNDPTITQVYNNNPTYGAITIQQNGVTVKGSFHMSSSLSNYGLYISEGNAVTLNGSFTFCGNMEGIAAGGKLTFSGGTVTAKGTAAGSIGIYCDDTVVNNTVTKVTAEGKDCAFVGDHLTLNGTRITSPVDAFYSEDARSICLADLSDVAKSAVIEPFSGTYYDLWLGSRHITSENCRDIYGDGKASYDPQTKTLTLSDPDIVGAYCEPDSMDMNYRIYAGSDLTVKGSYHIKKSDLNFFKPEEGSSEADNENDLYNGIRVEGSLTLDGDFTILAKGNPVSAEGNITVKSGTVKVVGETAGGIVTLEGNIILKKDIALLDVTSPTFPLWAREIVFESGLKLTEPAGGGLGVETSSNHQFIAASGSEAATHVVVEPVTEQPVVSYDLIVGGTVVTSKNKTDIFGDGKARYNPDTKTLTLDDPTLTKVYTTAGYTFSIISMVEGLTVAGKYHMTSAAASYGFYSSANATFDGDFTFMGTLYGVDTQTGLTIRSGSLKAVSNGVYAIHNKEGAITINSGVTKVEAIGASYAIVSQTLTLGQDMKITSPEGAVLYTITTQNLQTIVASGAIAQSAVIEYKPYVPTEPPTEAPAPTDPPAPTQAPTNPPPTQAPTNPPPTQAPTNPPPTQAPTNPPPTQAPTNPPPTQAPTEDPVPVTEYKVWVGSTRVTSKNKDDILNDGGKAKYDPDQGVLTLADPVISGSFLNTKILAEVDITLKGSYHMTQKECEYGLMVMNGNLALAGNFTFMGNMIGIYAHQYFSMKSGAVVKAVGGNDGVLSDWESYMEAGAVKLEVEGGRAAFIGKDLILQGGQIIALPKKGSIKSGVNGVYRNYHIIYEEDGTTWAKHAVVMLNTLHLDGSGTQSAPYQIKTASDWNDLADYVAFGGNTAGLYFKLINDISVSTVIGTEASPFKGSFNGNGHTLTVSYGTADSPWENDVSAPFAYAGNGCLIEDLHVDGSIRTSVWFAGSIIGRQDGTVTVKNCRGSVTIVSYKSGDGSTGGMVGRNDGGVLTITGCVFDGKLLTATDTGYCGGFMGSRKNAGGSGVITITDCVYDPAAIGAGETEVSATGSATFARGTASAITINNCYYTRTLGYEQGKLAYTVTGSNAALTLNGAPGLKYNNKIIAGQNDSVKLSVNAQDVLYTASAVVLTQTGSSLILNMPAENVTISPSQDELRSGFSDASSTAGYNNEDAEKFVDGKNNTKWCGAISPSPVTMTFKTAEAVTLVGYQLTTAGDAERYPRRNPVHWKLEGSTNGRSWEVLSEVSDSSALTADNTKDFTFSASAQSAYSLYRFTIAQNGGDASFQLSELRLYTKEKSDLYKEYDLWLGSTRVTSQNKNDILNDGGKAKFDPDTNTLTLSDPVISGNYNNSKIFSTVDLTLKGSYHMTEKETVNGVATSAANLTFSGDFTFMANDYAVAATRYTSIESGSLKAIGSTCGIYSNWELFIKEGAQKLEMEGGTGAYRGNNIIIEGNQKLTLPENGSIYKAYVYYYVFESDGETVAKHAVIKQPDRILGDADGSETVDIIDATLIQRYAAKMITADAAAESLMDVNHDNIVDIIDATLIQRYLCGLKTNLPIGETAS